MEKHHTNLHHDHEHHKNETASVHEHHNHHSHEHHHAHEHHKVNDLQHHDHHNHDHHNHEHGGHEHHAHMIDDFKKRFWISLLLTIPIMLLSPMIHTLLGLESLKFNGSLYVLFILSSFVFFYGGLPFLKGLYDEMKAGKPGMMTLIALAISVAYFYSALVVFGLEGELFFWELATLIDIMLLGHWIEMRAVMSASNALEEIIKLMPDEAHKINEDGSVSDTPISQLKHKDKLLIKPGEKVPADGKIIDGETSINESMITGESQPVFKGKGNDVIGGSINGEGSIKIEVEKIGEETFLSQVVTLVKEAQKSKSRTQNLANRAAFWLTIIAITAGAITMLGWLLLSGESFSFALSRTVTVMVITCPHALGLAIPLVVAVSTALSAKHGLLIKNRNAFEEARNIQAVIFDKTGTLTKGEFGITDIIPLDEKYNTNEILKFAASIESESEHPIAKSIVAASQEKFEVKEFRALPGIGAEGKISPDGTVWKDVKVVSPRYLKSIGQENDKIEKLSSEGKTLVYLLIDNKLAAGIALADIIREESKDTIKQLKENGIKTIMLTGDNKQAAKWVADKLEIDEFFAEVLPDKKFEKVKEVQNRGLITAMIGDGINDAPALAQANIGIAIGAGTDVAIETADIILVKSNPKDVVSLIKFAKATYSKMVQNLIWAVGYNVAAIPLAAGVLYSAGIILSPAVGAVLMSLSTIIAAINAKTLKA